ncbi:hypothetical protein OAS86_06625 [Gammaproteobacteria bacterium]|nr:hypothetical protein [Gammaproteobacteria bacterium]
MDSAWTSVSDAAANVAGAAKESVAEAMANAREAGQTLGEALDSAVEKAGGISAEAAANIGQVRDSLRQHGLGTGVRIGGSTEIEAGIAGVQFTDTLDVNDQGELVRNTVVDAGIDAKAGGC